MTGSHRRMSNPFISEQFMSTRQLMRSRVTPLELNMKKTMIVARGMARRRGTLLHDIGTQRRSSIVEELPHQINDKIIFSLKELWKRRKRTAAQQKAIDNKANKLFPKRKNRMGRRMSCAVEIDCFNSKPSIKNQERRLSLSAVEIKSRVRYSFLQEYSALGNKVRRMAATRIQARVRTYLQQSHYRIEQLKRRWARIEYEKIQAISRIEKKTKARKKAHKKKTLQFLEDLAEQATKARKLTDHLKRENRKIKDQNARLQQLCFKLRKINNHMDKTLGIHKKNFKSMWEFVEKMKNKKKRIEDKVKRYEDRIELHTTNVTKVQKRIDAEIAHKNNLMDTLKRIAATVAAKSSNAKLRALVDMASDGLPIDQQLLREIGDEEEDIDDEEFDLNKSFQHDMICETFQRSFVMEIEDDEETVDEGFLLALSMDDNSTISDVSSVYSDMEDSSFTDGGFTGGDATSVYEEVVVDEEEEEGVGCQQRLVAEGEEDVIEEIIEEVISDEEYVFEEVIVSSDEEDEDDAFSCQSSVWVDQGSIIM